MCGTPVDANFVAKGVSKSQVSLQHRKIASRAEAERMRTFWGECLVRLGEVIAGKR
jgi:hypothetical protein